MNCWHLHMTYACVTENHKCTTGLECSKFESVYYHVNLICIRKKYPQFTAAQVEYPPETRSLLTNEHYDLLRKAIGFTVQI